MRGSSEPTESWKMICISRRVSFSSERESAVRSAPSKKICPSVGSISRMQRPPERRLAAARLADEPERLAAPDLQVDAVDRLHVADGALEEPLADGKVLPQPVGGEQDVGRSGLGGAVRAAVAHPVTASGAVAVRRPRSQSQHADSCSSTVKSGGCSSQCSNA